MESPKKASVRHMEFQLQREKALTRDLEDRNKVLQAQIAQLEQDKAELRREKLQLTEEVKRVSKLEERLHAVQRECEAKESQLSIEREGVARAKAETEQVRSSAKNSIAAWCAAETQWLHDQQQLVETVSELKDKLQAAQEDAAQAHSKLTSAEALIEAKQQEIMSASAARSAAEKALQEQAEVAERCKAQLFDVQSKLYELQLADDKLREAVMLKDTELHHISAKLTKQIAWTEKAEQNIVSLNERLGTAKALQMEARNEAERLRCDLTAAEKANEQLQTQLHAVHEEQTQSAQSRLVLERAVEEMRGRLATLQETVRQRQLALHDAELARQTAQSESTLAQGRVAELTTQVTSLETQMQKLHSAIDTLEHDARTLTHARDELQRALEKATQTADRRSEEMVMMKANYEEELAALRDDEARLEAQLKDRAQFATSLSTQLEELTEKSALYYTRLQESERIVEEQRQSLSEMQAALTRSRRHSCEAQIVMEWYDWCANSMLDVYVAVCISAREQLLHWLTVHMDDKAALHAAEERVACCNKNSEVYKLHALSLQGQLDEVTQRLTVTSEKLAGAEERCATLSTQIQQYDEKASHLDAELHAAQLEVEHQSAALHSALQSKQEELQESVLKERQQCAHDVNELIQRLAKWCIAMCDVQQTHSRAQHMLFAEAMYTFAREAENVMQSLRTDKHNLEVRCRELSMYVTTAKAKLSHMESEMASEAEAHRVALATTTTTLRDLEARKEEAMNEVHRLLVELKAERETALAERSSLQSQLDEAKSRQAEAEKLCERVRCGLEYELKRKCEYKTALATLKDVYHQSIEYRHIEKSSAVEAIKEVSAEAAHWRRAAKNRGHRAQDVHSQGDNHSTDIVCQTCGDMTATCLGHSRAVSAPLVLSPDSTKSHGRPGGKRTRRAALLERNDNIGSEEQLDK